RLRSLEAQVAAVEARLDALAKSDSQVSLLETVPGVGTRTAEVIAAHLPDARRFRSADEVSAYAGLVPRQYQSGRTDPRGPSTRRGPKLLRSALVECAWCSLRYNPWARATWLRLQENGLSKKKAVVALARRLLVRCWAILRTGQPWRDPAPAATRSGRTGAAGGGVEGGGRSEGQPGGPRSFVARGGGPPAPAVSRNNEDPGADG